MSQLDASFPQTFTSCWESDASLRGSIVKWPKQGKVRIRQEFYQCTSLTMQLHALMQNTLLGQTWCDYSNISVKMYSKVTVVVTMTRHIQRFDDHIQRIQLSAAMQISNFIVTNNLSYIGLLHKNKKLKINWGTNAIKFWVKMDYANHCLTITFFKVVALRIEHLLCLKSISFPPFSLVSVLLQSLFLNGALLLL